MARDSRAAIVDGAARAFGRLGFAATRVEDILEESGISRATFYKFFNSKEAVFDALEEAFNLSFVMAMQAAHDDANSSAEEAEALVDAYLRWITGWRTVVKAMWLDPSRPRFELLAETRESAFKDFADLIAGLVDRDATLTGDEFVYRGILGAVSEIGQALAAKPRMTDADFRRARAAVIRVIMASVLDPPATEH